MSFYAVTLAVISLLGIEIAVHAFRRHTALLKAHEACMDQFHEAAATLLAADETPIEIVEILEFMQEKARQRSGSFQFLWLLFSSRHALARGSVPTSPAILGFQKASPALFKVFSRASTAAMLAMTFYGGPAGTLLRNLVFFDARQHAERTGDVAAGFREALRRPPAEHRAQAA